MKQQHEKEFQDTERRLRLLYLLNFNDPSITAGDKHTIAYSISQLRFEDGFLQGNVQKSPQGILANTLLTLMASDELPLRSSYSQVHNWPENLLFPSLVSDGQVLIPNTCLDPHAKNPYPNVVRE